MIHFFGNESTTVFAVQTQGKLSTETISKLNWLFANAHKIEESVLTDFFIGPRATMITPWSTNAVEITQNMGIEGVIRIEEFYRITSEFKGFDPMLSQKYIELNQDIFTIHIQPEAILNIDDIAIDYDTDIDLLKTMIERGLTVDTLKYFEIGFSKMSNTFANILFIVSISKSFSFSLYSKSFS